ncbi:MAG: DUF1653 domain-containing protein [Pedobacter sp.]|nr:DUF1653 domain-containing protein [Pedobacter sp.]
MSAVPELKPGRYRHYKGKDYAVIRLARHSETEEWLVVYRTLYGDFSWWLRPFEMFTESVIHEGQEMPRFRYIGPLEVDAIPVELR